MIYADANVLIRLLEGDAATRAPLEARLLPLRGAGRFLLTSRLSRLECRVKPLRANDAALLALYDAFFAGVEVELLELTDVVVEKATELRATLNVKTPDALHLASSMTAFLTGDRNLAGCIEIPVECFSGRNGTRRVDRMKPTGLEFDTGCHAECEADTSPDVTLAKCVRDWPP